MTWLPQKAFNTSPLSGPCYGFGSVTLILSHTHGTLIFLLCYSCLSLPFLFSLLLISNSLACCLPKELHMALQKTSLRVHKMLSKMANGLSLSFSLVFSIVPTFHPCWPRKKDACCKGQMTYCRVSRKCCRRSILSIRPTHPH